MNFEDKKKLQKLEIRIGEMRLAVICRILKNRGAKFLPSDVRALIRNGDTDQGIVDHIMDQQSLWFKVGELISRFFQRRPD